MTKQCRAHLLFMSCVHWSLACYTPVINHIGCHECNKKTGHKNTQPEPPPE